MKKFFSSISQAVECDICGCIFLEEDRIKKDGSWRLVDDSGVDVTNRTILPSMIVASEVSCPQCGAWGNQIFK